MPAPRHHNVLLSSPGTGGDHRNSNHLGESADSTVGITGITNDYRLHELPV